MLGKIHQHETATTNIARLGQGHRQGKTGGHRRVDGIATLSQDIGTDLTGQQRLGNHHALITNDRMKAGAIIDNCRRLRLDIGTRNHQ